MIATARSNGVLLAEAFKFRHHPQHLKAKEIVESGEIGEVKCIRSTFTTSTRDPEAMTPDANWRFNREKGGGAVYDLGCYNIHHARYIIGAEPTCVYAVGDFGALSHVDEAVAVLLKFPGDVTAQFSLGFRYFGSQSTEIYGTQGFIKTELSWNNRTKPVSLEVCFQGGSTATYDFVPINQFVLQLEHLCECLETGVPHRIPPENSLGNMRVIDAIFESMGSGQPVGLKHNE
jgi:predicted dehydrogenase